MHFSSLAVKYEQKESLILSRFVLLHETLVSIVPRAGPLVDNGVDNLADRLAKFQCYPIAFSQSDSSLTDRFGSGVEWCLPP